MIAHQTQRAGIARAVVCLSWLLECFNCRKTSGEPDECVNPTRQTRWSTSTAGAGSASLSAASPVGPLAAAAGVLSARPPSSPRCTAALVDAHLRSVCRASPCCGKPHRTAPPTGPTPSLRPRSPPSSTPPEVCPETMEFDLRRRHGTTTTHAPHSSPKVAWDTKRLSPERNQVHTVSPINKETFEFVNPARHKIMGSRNMKTCRRRAGGNFHLRPALDRVGILTVFSGEDAMQ